MPGLLKRVNTFRRDTSKANGVRGEYDSSCRVRGDTRQKIDLQRRMEVQLWFIQEQQRWLLDEDTRKNDNELRNPCTQFLEQIWLTIQNHLKRRFVRSSTNFHSSI